MSRHFLIGADFLLLNRLEQGSHGEDEEDEIGHQEHGHRTEEVGPLGTVVVAATVWNANIACELSNHFRRYIFEWKWVMGATSDEAVPH